MGRLFGTDGVRGRANHELSPELALRLGRAGAVAAICGKKHGKLVVGRDTRLSGDLIENAMVAGVLSAGADVLRIGVMPTPAVAYLTRAMEADGGIVISASHNPIEDNGIKFFDREGIKLSPSVENHIERMVLEDHWSLNEAVDVGVGRVLYVGMEARRRYIDHALGTLSTDLDGIQIVLDCAYGAVWQVGPAIFSEAGADVKAINNQPDGDKINVDCGSTNPECICRAVSRAKRGFGLSFDGDGDRVIAADERGRYLSGDVVMAIIAEHMHDGGYLANDTVAVTVMTNYGFDVAMAERGINIVKTDVGDRNVLEAMQEHNLNIGGEQSGHIIMLDHTTTGDGIITGLHLAAIVKQRGRLEDLGRIMERLPQVLVNVTVNEKERLAEAGTIWKRVEAVQGELQGHGRVLLRPSGTENLIRVMVEAETHKEAQAIASSLAELVKKELT